MNKLLLGTTALVTASLLAGGAMATEKKQAEPIKLSVGGYFQAVYVMGDQSSGRVTGVNTGAAAVGAFSGGAGLAAGATGLVNQPGFNRRNDFLTRESEIIIKGSTTLDNGLVVGAQVELEGESCSDQIDETYISFEHTQWGKIEVGATNSYAYKSTFSAPDVTIMGYVQSPDAIFANAGSNAAASSSTLLNVSGDSEKVTYITPRLYGLQFGLSYTPDGCQAGGVGGADLRRCFGSGNQFGFRSNSAVGTFGEIEDIWEIGGNYTREVATGVNFGLAASYGHGTNKGTFPGAGLGVLAIGASGATLIAGAQGNAGADTEQWGVSGLLSGMGFTLAGGWRGTENPGTVAGNDQDDWNIGASYAAGGWTIATAYATRSIEYARALIVAGQVFTEEEFDMADVGVSYAVGPGVTLSSSVIWYSWDASKAAGVADNNAALITRRNDAYVWTLGSVVAF